MASFLTFHQDYTHRRHQESILNFPKIGSSDKAKRCWKNCLAAYDLKRCKLFQKE